MLNGEAYGSDFGFTSGPEDWRKLPADPEKHWRTGYSARTLAHSWEAAQGFPMEVAEAITASDEPLLAGIEPVLAVPEFKVPLPGGGRASQNDLFVLGRSNAGPVSIMVEGKVNEPFGPTVGEWLVDASPGKEKRLQFLIKTLGLTGVPDASVRYQLFHRAASALITGEQYRACAAILLVHSFSQEMTGWTDYQAFAGLFGVEPVVGRIERFPSCSAIPLFGCWVVGNPEFLKA